MSLDNLLPNSPFLGAEQTAIYVHWPFCAKKCPYCDFNSHVRDEIDHARWIKSYEIEIDSIAQLYPNLKITSVFFGGGTPSLMPIKTVAALIEKISKTWRIDDTSEITLEANPSSAEKNRFQGYKEAGVNRLSVGLQSLNDQNLQFLGRLHNAREALDAVEAARSIFERVSFDMIYALPGQTPGNWEQELSKALVFAPSHLSLYQLTIEEGTAFYLQHKRGKFTLPDEETALKLYTLTDKITQTAGLPAYEVSNYARPGEEARHNLTYWQGRPYIGIGPGAHGRLPDTNGQAYATSGIKNPEAWQKQVQMAGHGYDAFDRVSNYDRSVEAIMMGLRLRSGINLRDIEDRFSINIDQVLSKSARQTLIDDQFLLDEKDQLTLTHSGRPVLNAVLARLLL